ncbi:MAG TPA: LysE family translocator [Noviherbaspirillum sp.]|nr:LysE family translocator [Noviherbaspirillum sp.]
MIAWEAWALILGFSVPMIISPGPGNTILAASGGRFGLKGSVPFWMGFEAGNLVWCLVYGFGLSQAFSAYPLAYQALKWAGTLYVLYLAYGFFRSSALSDQKDLRPLSFADGFMSLSFNPKVHSMILVMFSQFLDPSKPLSSQVVQMTAMFLVVCLGCHYLWIHGGQLLFSRIRTERAMRMQGWVFGACMLAVAASVARS